MTRRLAYTPALDGVRGVAVLLVMLGHSVGVPRGGGLGVDVFFVLSGFLITALLLREWADDGTVSLRGFYRRGALRLLPALVAMLVTVIAIVAALAAQGEVEAGRLGASLAGAAVGVLYVGNVAQAWWGMLDAVEMRHLWSLAAEEQFYLVWPLVLVVLLRRGADVRALCRILIVVIACVAAWRATLAGVGAPIERLWFAPDTRADALLIGCLAGIAYAARLTLPLRLLVPPAAVVVAVVPLVFTWEDRALYVAAMPAFLGAVAILLLATTTGAAPRLARLLELRPLVGVGKISYALYLWHWPIFVAVDWVAGWPLAFAAALLSYRYVEAPFLRLKRREHVVPAAARAQPS